MVNGFWGYVDFNDRIKKDERENLIKRITSMYDPSSNQYELFYMKDRATLFRKITKNKIKYNDTNDIKSNKPADIISERSNSNEGKVVCFIYGSIYNTSEIRKKISTTDNYYRGISNEAVVANLYRKYQDSFIDHLDGDFSLILWDEEKERIVLAKDQLGSFPLFYAHQDRIFFFSSEINPLISCGLIPIEVNETSIDDFMSYGYVPNPETMFKNIFQLEPGMILCATREHIGKKYYWEFEFKDHDEKDEEYYTATLLELLIKAVRKRTASNLKVGAFLSGGLDSSGICGILKKYTDKSFKAYSIGFKEDVFNEIPYAEVVVNNLGLDWKYDFVEPNMILPLFEKLIALYGTPFEDTSAFPSYYAAQLASYDISVVLTGDGPDQLMAGSEHHVSLKKSIDSDNLLLSILRRSNAKNIFQKYPIKVEDEHVFNKVKRRIYWESLYYNERVYEPKITPLLLKRYLYSKHFLDIQKSYNPARHIMHRINAVSHRHPIEQSLYHDTYYYMHDDLSPKVERSCNINSILPMYPYRDKELIAFIETLPLKFKLNGTDTKYVLKKALRHIVPEQIIYKKKQGFAIPREQWFINNYKEYIKQILLDKRCLDRSYFDPQSLKSIIERYLSGQVSYYTCSSALIMSLLTLELWHRIFIDNL